MLLQRLFHLYLAAVSKGVKLLAGVAGIDGIVGGSAYEPGRVHAPMSPMQVKRDWVLKKCSVSDVWGVGRKMTLHLKGMGIKSAWDLFKTDP